MENIDVLLCIKENNGYLVHDLEIDFIINASKSGVKVIISEEYCDYR